MPPARLPAEDAEAVVLGPGLLLGLRCVLSLRRSVLHAQMDSEPMRPGGTEAAAGVRAVMHAHAGVLRSLLRHRCTLRVPHSRRVVGSWRVLPPTRAGVAVVTVVTVIAVVPGVSSVAGVAGVVVAGCARNLGGRYGVRLRRICPLRVSNRWRRRTSGIAVDCSRRLGRRRSWQRRLQWQALPRGLGDRLHAWA